MYEGLLTETEMAQRQLNQQRPSMGDTSQKL